MMTSANPDDPSLFSARLTPHRSLSRRGFVWLMIIVSALSFAAGLAFWLMGAWPVMGFFGLDVLLIWWAFRVNFGRARAYEDIAITAGEFRLRRVSHRGHSLEWTFNPLWVRLERKTHEDYGLERLYLVSRGQRVALARFLGPDEKERLAHALDVALAAARRGPTLSSIR